jgi:hypothetical protein
MCKTEHDAKTSARGLSCTLLGLFALTSSGTVRADVLTLKNGDRLTGEFQSLDRGLLSFDIDASTSTLQIEWDDVGSLISERNLEIRLDTGERLFGSLSDAAPVATLVVESDGGTRALPMTQVVHMIAIEDTFRERLSGDISAGYNFTEASDVAQLNLALGVAYETSIRIVEASFDSVATDSGDTDSFTRSDLSLRHTRRLRNRWVAGQLAVFERNESLGIDLRSSIGGGAGRILRETNERYFGLFGGAVLSEERLADSSAVVDSVEALFAVNAEWFRYDEPELDLTTRFSLLPSLSESGRIRTSLDVDLRWGITSDLYLGFSLYHTSDSEPPTADAAKRDFGIVTSLGWEF